MNQKGKKIKDFTKEVLCAHPVQSVKADGLSKLLFELNSVIP